MTTTKKIKLYFKTLTFSGKVLYALIVLLILSSVFYFDNLFLAIAISAGHYLYTTDPGFCPRAKEIFAPQVESM